MIKIVVPSCSCLVAALAQRATESGGNQSGELGLALAGETLLAIFYGLVMILGGIFVWWRIRNYYTDGQPW